MTTATTTQSALQQAGNSVINATARDAKARREGPKDSLGKQDFLNLLMAQVTNQDPLNPMDSKGMMDQLTQMGSMEQLINLNNKVDGLNQTQASIVRSTAYSFLDKDITVNGGRAQVSNGTAPRLHFDLPREATQVKVTIADAGGVPVRTLELGRMAPGRHNLDWDVRDSDGDPVADGIYRYNVDARTAEDESLPVGLLLRGKVSGVKFKDGKPLLLMSGGEVGLQDILEVSNASQRLFSDRQPRPLMEEMKPKPPVEKL